MVASITLKDLELAAVCWPMAGVTQVTAAITAAKTMVGIVCARFIASSDSVPVIATFRPPRQDQEAQRLGRKWNLRLKVMFVTQTGGVKLSCGAHCASQCAGGRCQKSRRPGAE